MPLPFHFGRIVLRLLGSAKPCGSEMVILQKRVAGLNENSLERFLTKAKRAVGLRGAVTVLVTSNQELRRLNQRFRGVVNVRGHLREEREVLFFARQQLTKHD